MKKRKIFKYTAWKIIKKVGATLLVSKATNIYIENFSDLDGGGELLLYKVYEGLKRII